MFYVHLLKKWFLILIFLGFPICFLVFNWSFVFKKKVVGEVVAVERINVGALAVLADGKGALNSQVFSFSVGIKDLKTSEIFMASSEDRQWAAVQKGNCVIAAYFPYPPWNIMKANTSHNARLIRNFINCNQMPLNEGFLEMIKFFFLMP